MPRRPATLEARKPMASPAELAAYLGLSIETVYAWRKTGYGPKGIRAGRHVRYPWTAIDAWVESQLT